MFRPGFRPGVRGQDWKDAPVVLRIGLGGVKRVFWFVQPPSIKASLENPRFHSGLFSSSQLLKTCRQGTGSVWVKITWTCFLLVVFGKPKSGGKEPLPSLLEICFQTLLVAFPPDRLLFLSHPTVKLAGPGATQTQCCFSLVQFFTLSLYVLNCEQLRHPHVLIKQHLSADFPSHSFILRAVASLFVRLLSI